jgi:redox-sensitive bicupin YhaK (pirin superfamily)
MITPRRAQERGQTSLPWLSSRHTFSFAEYYDPNHMGFSVLRVINDDRIAAGGGFPSHPHRDMEIVTIVLDGALAHRDNLGNGSVIRPGEVQRMTAGRGIVHSEFNSSATEPLHLLQIWLLPDRPGLAPGYEQKRFERAENDFPRLVVSPDGQGGSLTINQDARLSVGALGTGNSARVQIGDGRRAWIHVARGRVRMNGVELNEGDGAGVESESALEFSALSDAQLLLFDLP